MIKQILNKFFPGDNIAVAGIAWNIFSYGIVGVSGLALNMLIGYGGQGLLGAFNQIMAIYIVLGQIGALGLQNAAIRYIVKYNADEKKRSLVFTTFFFVSVISGFVISLLLYFLREPIGLHIFKSELVYIGIKMLVPALFLFSVNKVLTGIINGFRMMRVFAVIQAARYIFLILFASVVILFFEEKNMIMYSFLFAECIVFVLSFKILLTKVRFTTMELPFLKESIQIGTKFMAGGIIGEINTKLDIMVLGYFCSDEIVGIYSMASILAEGFFSLISVIKTNMNPIFAQLLLNGNKESLRKIIKDIKFKITGLSFCGAIGVMTVYYFICLISGKEYFQAFFPLTYILVCMVLASSAIVKGNLLGQRGNPEIDSFITLGMVFLNFIFNVLLIPRWQIAGAAFATGTSYLFLIFLQSYFINKYIWRQK